MRHSGIWGLYCIISVLKKNPFKIRKNIWALRELIRIIDREAISVVHCHNPNGGVLGRLAAVLSKRKPFVVYTAHGFHFFSGSTGKKLVVLLSGRKSSGKIFRYYHYHKS